MRETRLSTGVNSMWSSTSRTSPADVVNSMVTASSSSSSSLSSSLSLYAPGMAAPRKSTDRPASSQPMDASSAQSSQPFGAARSRTAAAAALRHLTEKATKARAHLAPRCLNMRRIHLRGDRPQKGWKGLML